MHYSVTTPWLLLYTRTAAALTLDVLIFVNTSFRLTLTCLRAGRDFAAALALIYQRGLVHGASCSSAKMTRILLNNIKVIEPSSGISLLFKPGFCLGLLFRWTSAMRWKHIQNVTGARGSPQQRQCNTLPETSVSLAQQLIHC